MTKKILTFSILFIVLTGVLAPFSNVFANASSDCRDTGGVWVPNIVTGGGTCATNTNNPQQRQVADQVTAKATAEGDGTAGWIWKKFAQGIGYVLITISSLALLLSGWLFDMVIKYTIIDMAKNLSGGPGGIGDAITLAWATLRDIANMCFIFVLLYAAFKTMFDSNFGNFQTTIKNIIIVALLINFSLFFSKVVIDASNIVAVGFYKSITSNSVTYDTNTTKGSSFEKTISAGYMNMLGLQTFFGSNILTNGNLKDGGQILTVGIITAVFMLITAVILLVAGIMFVARFIILIFIMILSPLALIAYIIPGQSKHFDEWLDALKNQSFFAPLYFALTWVVFKLGTSLIGVLGKTTNGKPMAQWSEITTNPSGVMPLIINYVLIIGFSIAALIFAKQMATKGAAGTAFKAVAGGVGATALGSTAFVGRKVIGGASSLISEKYRDTLSKTSYGRAGLWMADKGKKGSFDVRNVGNASWMKKVGADSYLNENLGVAGKAGGKGGYQAAMEEKAKKKAAYAKDVYGKTDKEKEDAEELKEEYEKGDKKKNYDSAVENEKKEVTDAEKKAAGEKKKAEEEVGTKKKELEQAKKDGKTNQEQFEIGEKIKQAEEELSKKSEAHNLAITRMKSVIDDKNYSKATKALGELAETDRLAWQKVEDAATNRQEEYAKRLEGKLSGAIDITTGGATGAVIGGVVGGPIGAAIGAGIMGTLRIPKENRKVAARAVRKQKKGKTEEEQLAELAEKVAKKKIDKEKIPDTTSPAPNPNP